MNKAAQALGRVTVADKAAQTEALEDVSRLDEVVECDYSKEDDGSLDGRHGRRQRVPHQHHRQMSARKPKRGRPPKPAGECAEEWLRLRIPSAELVAIHRAARKAGAASVSAFVRETMKGACL
jgi:hypothetical protein